jgi:hypothetical protein
MDDALAENPTSQLIAASSRSDNPAGARKLVQNGTIFFEVVDASKTRGEIALFVNDLSGYIASEKIHKDDNMQQRFEMVARIPGSNLEKFISRIEAMSTRIDDREFSAQDVTEEYVDLESRLAAKRELETRFREIVRQAATIEDILKIEEQIGVVRGDIESIQGRLKVLSNRVSYATITLTYYQPYSAPAIVVPGLGSKFASAFLGGWDSLVRLTIGLTRIWPYLIILSAATWIWLRRRRREARQLIHS